MQRPPCRSSRLCVALPASLLSEAPGLREKTLKAGLVGRACAIFRVDEVVVYKDVEGCEEDAELLVELLNYMCCPQYLRKLVYPLKPSLRYVGTLPPLRTPNHPLESRVEDLPSSSFREGLVIECRRGVLRIEAGLRRLIEVEGRARVGERVVLELRKMGKGRLKAKVIDREQVPYYFGFTAKLDLRTLSQVVASLRGSGYDFVLATSRLGRPLNEALGYLRKRLKADTLILYGSPREGLAEILRREGLSLNDIAELTINFIPHQGVETVRTEEALMASLAVVNMLTNRAAR
ncbi:MAG: hypothetical protein DRJ69_02095 [Thermoprotei archaeon]|nr:MAG: hypothetical protein DRJ69_02095 [Thermoprotei archaeon]